jgi:hypothetical protein
MLTHMGQLSRRSREQRAFQLVVVGGTASVIAVVALVLAIVGVVNLTTTVLAVLVAAACFVMFRRATSSGR